MDGEGEVIDIEDDKFFPRTAIDPFVGTLRYFERFSRMDKIPSPLELMSKEFSPLEANTSFVVSGGDRADATMKDALPTMVEWFLCENWNVSYGYDGKDLKEGLLEAELESTDANDVNSGVVTVPVSIAPPLLLKNEQPVTCGDAEWAVGGSTTRPLSGVLGAVRYLNELDSLTAGIVNGDDDKATEGFAVVTMVTGFTVSCWEPQVNTDCEDILLDFGDMNKFLAPMDTEDDELRSSSRGSKMDVEAGNRVADLDNDWGSLDDDGNDCGDICWLVKIDDTFTDASLAETNCTLASNNSHKRVNSAQSSLIQFVVENEFQ